MQSRITVLGDTLTGKTSLILSYTKEGFFASLPRTVLDKYIVEAEWQASSSGKALLTIFDVCSEPSILDPHLRSQVSDVFILVYDRTNRESFCSVIDLWIPKVARYGKPIICVGTKSDLSVAEPLDTKMLCSAASMHGLICDCKETSASLREGVEAIFLRALEFTSLPSARCCVLL